MFRLYVYENDMEISIRTTGATNYGDITLDDLVNDTIFWKDLGSVYSVRLVYVDEVTLKEIVIFEN